MNPRTELLHTLSYGLITKQFLLPARNAEKGPILTDTQDILEKSTSKALLVVKLLDGDTLGPQVVLSDISALTNVILQRRTTRERPLFASYYIAVTSFLFDSYQQALSSCISSLIQEKIGISITLLSINSGEIYTVNCNQKLQQQVLKQVTEDFKASFSAGSPKYDVPDILSHLNKVSASASKVGAISGISATKILIGINIAVWLVGMLVKFLTGYDYFLLYGCQHNPSIFYYHEYWRLFTPMFLHGDFLHLASNSYFLYICGEMVERIYGKKRFLLLYFVTGFCGNLLSLFLLEPNAISVGASGACMGLGGVIVYLWMRRKNNFLRYFQNMTSFIVMILFNVFYGFFFTGINNWAHLGGFVSGVLLGLLFEAIEQSKIAFPKGH